MTLKEAAITLAITVLFTAFILVAIDTFYERPEYEDYCEERPIPPRKIEVDCEYDAELEDQCYTEEGTPRYDYDENGCRIYKECDFCSKDLREANNAYSRNLFLILAVIGIAAIFAGVYYKIEFIGTGFMFSGIILLLYGTMQYFDVLNKYLRLVIVFIELLLVLFIAFKKVVK